MEISITVKQLGKKQPVLLEKPITINYSKNSIPLAELLKLIVENQLNAFNMKNRSTDDDGSPRAVQHNYLEVLMDTGKAGFGNVYNENNIALLTAQENVIQAFEDGIFVIFQAEEQIHSLQQTIQLSANLSFTFIRLTFLAGSYW